MPDVPALLEFTGRCPGRLRGLDLVERAPHVGPVTYRVEDEEFGLRPEVGGVGNARRLQVSLGALGDCPGIAVVALHRRRLDDIAAKLQGGLLHEGIDDRAGGIGHQDHVRLVDPLPAGDR